MPIVAFYAAVLGVLFVGLSVRTLRMRRTLRIAVGDAGNPAMLRAMRVHSNFAEYVPISLLLIYFVESGAAPVWLVHGLGLGLLIGRGVHAYGLSRLDEDYRFRVVGMTLTLTVLLVASTSLLLRCARQALG